MNLKESAYKIKTQTNALNKLLEGMDTTDWNDETPIGVTIFLKHIIDEIDRLYNALPGEPSSFLPSGLTAAQYEQVSNLREKVTPPPSGAGNNRKPRKGKAAQGAKQSRGRGHGK